MRVFDHLPNLCVQGYQGRQIQYVQGMTLGGSSASNYMGYFRPTVGSLQHWAAEVDDDFWSWENVYPAFKRSCNFSSPDPARFTAPVLFDPNAFEQGAGPLHVSYGNFQNDYAAPLGRSLDDLGFRQLNGLNSGELIGYATSTVAIDPEYGTRSSSETSFLQLAAKQSSIKIYPNSIADRVLFDEHKKANGVLIRTNSLYQSFLYQLNANREVIVSAGAWHSPQILMLSGIGPAATLNEHGIPVIADLPGVGQNAWDQPFISTSFKVSNVTTYTQIAAGNVQANADATNQFLNQQGGPLASIGGGQAVAFEKYPVSLRQQFSNATLDYLASLPSDWPEAEYLDLAYSSFPSDLGPDDQYLQLGCAMLSPASRGNMTIRSNCILDPPRINPNWLADEGDRQQAVAALKRIRQIMNGTGFVVEPYAPPASVVTDAEILEWLQDNMSLIYHPSSTCELSPSLMDTAFLCRC
jgi:choline dehydrogenase